MHVHVSREFLESVEKDVICKRPAWRIDTAQVDTHCDSALLMSDHSLFTHGIEMSLCGLSSTAYYFYNFISLSHPN